MDLVHEDSEIEKKYIKRLMKHKKMESKFIFIFSLIKKVTKSIKATESRPTSDSDRTLSQNDTSSE